MENHLQEVRKAHGVTQRKMAKDLGVAVSTIQNWESDRTLMTGHSLVMVADYFGVSPNEIYGDGTPSPPSMTDEEEELLSCYRAATPAQRSALLHVARTYASDGLALNTEVSGGVA